AVAPVRAELILRTPQRLGLVFCRVTEHEVDGIDSTARLFGGTTDEVIVIHRRVAAEPAVRVAELAEAAAHPLGHDRHGAFAERTGRGRRGGARYGERLEPPPRRLGVERADHARAGAASLALEAGSQGLDR